LRRLNLNLEKDRVTRASHSINLLTPVSGRVSLRAGAGVNDSGVFLRSVNSSNSGHLSATTSIVSTPRASFAGTAVCVSRPISTTWLMTSCSTSSLCFTLLIYNRFNRWSKAANWGHDAAETCVDGSSRSTMHRQHVPAGLLATLPKPDYVLADTAYDADKLRQSMAERSATASSSQTRRARMFRRSIKPLTDYGTRSNGPSRI
jgi:hypothetical protein